MVFKNAFYTILNNTFNFQNESVESHPYLVSVEF